MLAQLTSYIVNFGFRSPRKQTTPKDFMPSQRAKGQTETKPTRMTPKRRREIVNALRTFFPKV